ncbi:hypothetical protein J2X36_004549 [Methylobacterium sp. BE186]|uniref:hypothetical protein n=1 Tax=Methylobacterium sp. BE186 TaxID=2817715 RepID=UPI00285DDE8F|nr:hypothetical protein [Methylobacterium sp. BE186]MDR7039771.1 hypothetical protein [Methylobacterium sp. BE186]
MKSNKSAAPDATRPNADPITALEIKVTLPVAALQDQSMLGRKVAHVMRRHSGIWGHEGISLLTQQRDWIYIFRQVPDESALLDALQVDLTAALGRKPVIESFRPTDAYPGDHSVYSYPPGHLVRQRR